MLVINRPISNKTQTVLINGEPVDVRLAANESYLSLLNPGDVAKMNLSSLQFYPREHKRSVLIEREGDSKNQNAWQEPFRAWIFSGSSGTTETTTPSDKVLSRFSKGEILKMLKHFNIEIPDKITPDSLYVKELLVKPKPNSCSFAKQWKILSCYLFYTSLMNRALVRRFRQFYSCGPIAC